MTYSAEIVAALRGWSEMLLGRGGAARFSADRRGLFRAVLLYVVMIAGNIAVASAYVGWPEPLALLTTVIINVLPLVVVLSATAIATGIVQKTFLPLAVPVSYALAFTLAIDMVLLAAGLSEFANVLLGVIGLMLFAGARGASGFSIGAAIGYAILTLVALVGISAGFYMLLTQGQGL